MDKQIGHKKKLKKAQFSLYAPQANEVFLLGDFNQWDSKKHQMKKEKPGVWEKTVLLTPGTHEYKYIVDGKWQEDPVNREKRLNSFGTYNNLLTIAE